MNIVELLKRSNHYTNHREYTEKVIKDYVEIAQPLRLKYPNATFKMLIDTQHSRNGGRGTEPFDSKEKMMQIEREVLGIVGSKFNTASRQTASRTTFANSIREKPENFTIYNEKLKQEKIISDQKIAQQLLLIQNQTVTFEEQVNSGDFNDTPITDVNLSSGCSECTGTEIRHDPIEVSSMPPSYQSQGYHKMPDGSLMKDSDMEKEPLNNNMKMAGIAGIGIIGLLLYSRSVKK
tara:strand:- start:946 stop:1650 length:705 start_codon:yes stop_codon:yes gene_type:complete